MIDDATYAHILSALFVEVNSTFSNTATDLWA